MLHNLYFTTCGPQSVPLLIHGVNADCFSFQALCFDMIRVVKHLVLLATDVSKATSQLYLIQWFVTNGKSIQDYDDSELPESNIELALKDKGDAFCLSSIFLPIYLKRKVSTAS